MTILKSIFLVFLTLIFFILEISIPVIPMGVSLIFVLLVVLLIQTAKDDKNIRRSGLKYVFLTCVLGGILLDCYSVFPPGLFLLSLLIVSYFSEKFLLSKFNINKILSILIFSLTIALIYQFLILIFSYCFYFLGLLDFRIYLDKFYWLSIFQAVILNGLLITMFSSGLKLIKSKYKYE